MNSTTISVGPWELNAARAPLSGAPSLVLTSPWPWTLRTFERIWPRLTPHFDVTVVDLPGFGASPLAPELMRPRAMADVIEALLREVAPNGAHLVASDVGVPAALAYAARDGSLLKSLTLSDGPGTANPSLSPELRRAVSSRLVRWLYALTPGLFVRLSAKNGYQRSEPGAAALDEAIAAHSRPAMLRHTLEYLASYPEELPAIEAQLGDIDVPTLLLWGERDLFVPPENAVRIAARIHGASIVRLAAAGHYSHDDDVDGYTGEMLRFIDRVESRSNGRGSSFAQA